MWVTPIQEREWRLFIQIDRLKSSISTYKSKYAVSQIQTDVKQYSKVPRFSGAPCSLVKKQLLVAQVLAPDYITSMFFQTLKVAKA